MLFSWTFFLCGVTFWASLRCGKAYGSSKLLLQLNFFHNLFIVCIGKAFTHAHAFGSPPLTLLQKLLKA